MKKKPTEKSSITREEKIDQVCLELSKYYLDNELYKYGKFYDIYVEQDGGDIYLALSIDNYYLDHHRLESNIRPIFDDFISEYTRYEEEFKLFRKNIIKEIKYNTINGEFFYRFNTFYIPAINQIIEERQKNEQEILDKKVENIKNILQQSN